MRICDVLLEMRRCRMGLIQTADQLRFSYLAVIEGAKFIMGDSSLQVGHRSQNLPILPQNLNGVLFPPSEGFLEGALKRGRRPPAVLPSASSAAPPGTTKRRN